MRPSSTVPRNVNDQRVEISRGGRFSALLLTTGAAFFITYALLFDLFSAIEREYSPHMKGTSKLVLAASVCGGILVGGIALVYVDYQIRKRYPGQGSTTDVRTGAPSTTSDAVPSSTARRSIRFSPRFLLLLTTITSVAAATYVVFWQQPDANRRKLEAISRRFNEIPIQVTTWSGQDLISDLPDDANVVQFARTYTNEENGDKVKVILVAGQSRDVMAFLPSVCFCDTAPSPDALDFDAGLESFECTTYVSRPGVPYAGFKGVLLGSSTSDGKWTRPNHFPGWHRNQNLKYQLQFVCEEAEPANASEKSKCVESATATIRGPEQQLLPHVNAALFGLSDD